MQASATFANTVSWKQFVIRRRNVPITLDIIAVPRADLDDLKERLAHDLVISEASPKETYHGNIRRRP